MYRPGLLQGLWAVNLNLVLPVDSYLSAIDVFFLEISLPRSLDGEISVVTIGYLYDKDHFQCFGSMLWARKKIGFGLLVWANMDYSRPSSFLTSPGLQTGIQSIGRPVCSSVSFDEVLTGWWLLVKVMSVADWEEDCVLDWMLSRVGDWEW